MKPMLVQIISDPSTANWVIAIAVVIIGVLLVRILNRLEATQKEHEERITQVEKDVIQIRATSNG